MTETPSSSAARRRRRWTVAYSLLGMGVLVSTWFGYPEQTATLVIAYLTFVVVTRRDLDDR